MWSYVDSRSAVRDALRLSRAMTFKSAVAGLPLGGGKGVIMLPAGHAGAVLAAAQGRAARLRRHGRPASSGRYITAEDVGISSRDMAVIAERTRYVTGLSRRRGGSGDPSPYTALGVEEAIRVGCERVFGTGDLKDRTVAVLGLGHVGARLARGCARAGAKLLVSDIDGAKRAVARELGARWVDPAHALSADVDVVAPVRAGRRARPRVDPAPALRRDRRLGQQPARRGRAWPTCCAPTGSCGRPTSWPTPAGSSTSPPSSSRGGYDPKRARARVRGIGDTLKEIFDEADRTGTTPLTAAMLLARRRLGETVRAPRTRPARG